MRSNEGWCTVSTATELVVQELEELAPSIVGMLCACSVPDLQIALDAARAIVAAVEAEFSGRGVTPQESKAAIDAATQAAIAARFPKG